MDDDRNAARHELRRRMRRVGLIQAIGGGLMALLFRSAYGILAGALLLALGFYSAFGYVPLAAWIRRREQSR